jgi:crotonobetainyl-CoA:carnitine CoA-transferase CaiB-like acyl-CoA transferase
MSEAKKLLESIAKLSARDRAKVQKILAKADRPSQLTLCQRWLIANPKMTARQLVERLHQSGHPNATLPTVSALRSNTLGLLRELVEHGHVPESIYEGTSAERERQAAQLRQDTAQALIDINTEELDA